MGTEETVKEGAESVVLFLLMYDDRERERELDCGG